MEGMLRSSSSPAHATDFVFDYALPSDAGSDAMGLEATIGIPQQGPCESPEIPDEYSWSFGSLFGNPGSVIGRLPLSLFAESFGLQRLQWGAEGRHFLVLHANPKEYARRRKAGGRQTRFAYR